MTFEDGIIRSTVGKLLLGCDYRDEVVNAINASFFDFSLKFFREIVEAKLSGHAVNMSWYREHFIVDGHNRYRICTAHNISYKTEARDFKDRNEAMLWMFQNQLARRNLTDFQRIEMVRRFEQTVKARAKERQGTRTDLSDNPMEKFPQATPVPLKSAQRNIVPKSAGSRSRDELAQMAGVGHSTYEQAPEAVVEAARANKLSINAAYQVIKLPEGQQQLVAERISQGEKPREVIADVRRQKNTYWDKLLKNAEKTAKEGKNVKTVLNLLEQAIAILKAARER